MHSSLRFVEEMLCTEPAEWDFPHRVFTTEGGLYLMDALRQNTTLRELQLRSCHLGPEGARSLAATVTQNTTLRSIKLTNNAIGREGATALAAALRTNIALQEVSLSGMPPPIHLTEYPGRGIAQDNLTPLPWH
eukprot:EG_transcript_37072